MSPLSARGTKFGYMPREDRLLMTLPAAAGAPRFALTRRQCIFIVSRCEGATSAGAKSRVPPREPAASTGPGAEKGDDIVLPEIGCRRQAGTLVFVFRSAGREPVLLKLSAAEQAIVADKLRQIAERAGWNLPSAQRRTPARPPAKRHLH